MTPRDSAKVSPRDLLIARPGESSFFSQTRMGPTDPPLESLNESILPFILNILSHSPAKLGLWSLDKASTSQVPYFPFYARLYKIHLESPTFDTMRVSLRTNNVTAVVPLYYVSNPYYFISSFNVSYDVFNTSLIVTSSIIFISIY